MSVLSVAGVSKSFGGLAALSDVSLECRRGQVTALIGPNGAGKSTLFNVVTGLIKPDTGTILHRGDEIAGKAPHRIARRGLARTFQNVRLLPDMTAFENVLVGCHTTGGSTARERAAHAMRQLEFFGVEGRADDVVGALPIGDQRRIELARALARNPGVLLLDEPAAGLSDQEAGELIASVSLLRERDMCVLLVEHNLRLVRELADHVVVLDRGQVIATGSTTEIGRHAAVRAAYLGSHEL